jgi:hypothetical protein
MTRGARGSVARIGEKNVDFAPHHVGGGCGNLMAFARIETCSTGVADVLAETMSPAVCPRGFRGNGGHVGCCVDGRRDRFS